MKKFIIIIGFLFCFCSLSVFAQGLKDGNQFINENIGGFSFICGSINADGMPAVVDKGASVVIGAYAPLDSMMYLIPFAYESDALEFIKAYLALASFARGGLVVESAGGVIDLIKDYTKKRYGEFVIDGVIFCWTPITYGKESEK
jgi:hypothetical protein